MRTLVDLGDAQIQALDELSKKRSDRARWRLIRQAIDDYLGKRRDEHKGDAFGLWGKRKVRFASLAYQRKVRQRMVKALLRHATFWSNYAQRRSTGRT